MKKNTIQLKPYSLVELAKLYTVCDRTMKKWIKPFEQEVGEKNGRYYSISQVKIIFDKLGLPSEIEI
jgi:hypothetical protein